MRKKLTSTFVETAPLPTERRSVEYHDQVVLGLSLRVTETGFKSYSVVYRMYGRLRRYTLGNANVITLADARDMARAALQKVAKGIDPAEEKVFERNEPTISVLSKDFINRHVSHLRRAKETERLIKREILPTWGNRRAKDITRRDVVALLDKIHERAPYGANRVLAVISKMYNWAIARDVVSVNPCFKVQKPGKEIKRERFLTKEEIKLFWNGCDHVHPKIAGVLKVMLLTGQRKTEVSHMRWQDIDNDLWTIPSEFCKNGKTHRVPLSSMAKKIIDLFPKDNDWVFSSPRCKNQPLSNLQKSFETIRSNIGIKDIHIHDLRRTAASHMASIGIPRMHISKILNHSESGVTAIYDRHTYDTEKKESLNKWAIHLESLITIV